MWFFAICSASSPSLHIFSLKRSVGLKAMYKGKPKLSLERVNLRLQG